MNALIVYANPEPTSFRGALKDDLRAWETRLRAIVAQPALERA